MEKYFEAIEEMEFVVPEEMYKKIDTIKYGYSKLNLQQKKLYKSYFYTQLCLLKPLQYRDIFWQYIVDVMPNEFFALHCRNFEKDMKY